jgi:hypothetical protein
MKKATSFLQVLTIALILAACLECKKGEKQKAHLKHSQVSPERNAVLSSRYSNIQLVSSSETGDSSDGSSQKQKTNPSSFNTKADSSLLSKDKGPLTLAKISAILDSVQDESVRQSIALDFLSLLFETKDSLYSMFPLFVSELGLSTKDQILNEFFNRFVVDDSLKRSVDSAFQQQQQQAGSNAGKCVQCNYLRMIDTVMCGQDYPTQAGVCVFCDTLKKMTTLLCALNCSAVNATVSSPLNGNPIMVSTPCVYCETLFLSTQFFCGPPNCTSTDGPYYSNMDDAFLFDESKTLHSKRSLTTNSFSTVTCIPCYYQYTAYQLLCGDLFSYCPSPAVSSTPTASPLPSPTSSPAPSYGPYYYYYNEYYKYYYVYSIKNVVEALMNKISPNE